MKKAAPRKPNKLVLFFLKPLVLRYFKSRYGLIINKSKSFEAIKGPFVLICNHGSVYDPLIVQAAIKQPLNFVGGYKYFYKKLTRDLLKTLGAIPKFQYQLDIKAIKQMIEVSRNKGNLCLFPTGRLPSCGEGLEVTEAVAKLLKKCDVCVATAKLNGSYLTRPKWAKSSRKGHIFLDYDILLSKKELEELDIKDITKKINNAIKFNDYEWNKKQHIKYNGKNLCKGLETTLYKCPSCGKEFEMTSKDNKLYCSCGKEYEINQEGMFVDSIFEHPQIWFEYQREEIRKEMDYQKILIEDEATIKQETRKGQVIIDKGKISLDHTKIIFKSDKQEIFFPIKSLYSIPYKAGVNIELAKDNNIYQFYLKNGNHAVKWCLFIEELYKKDDKKE